MAHQMNGAESKNGTTEAQINLAIVLKIQQLLEQSGCTVLLTRSDENAIYDLDAKTLKEKKISDIHNRVKIGNDSSADIFVSIHLNKIAQQQYYGWQTFFNTNNEQSKVLAEEIQSNLNEVMQKENGSLNYVKMEEGILKFWEDNKIFDKLKEKNKKQVNILQPLTVQSLQTTIWGFTTHSIVRLKTL